MSRAKKVQKEKKDIKSKDYLRKEVEAFKHLCKAQKDELARIKNKFDHANKVIDMQRFEIKQLKLDRNSKADKLNSSEAFGYIADKEITSLKEEIKNEY